MTDVARGRELLAASTPGEWKVVFLDTECAAVTEPHQDLYVETAEGPRTVGCATLSPADAALVVFLQNAAPELLRTAEDVEKLREVLSDAIASHVRSVVGLLNVSHELTGALTARIARYDADLRASLGERERLKSVLRALWLNGRDTEARWLAFGMLRTGELHEWEEQQDETNCRVCGRRYDAELSLAGCEGALREGAREP